MNPESSWSKFWRHVSTGPDNQTIEPANVMAIVHCLFTMMVASTGTLIWLWKAWIAPNVPDLQSFGIGLSAVGASVAAAIWALGKAQAARGDAAYVRRDGDK
jgi:hypothetical protein